MYKHIKINLRKRLISGVLIAIPFVVTLLVIKWLFNIMAGFFHPIVVNLLPKILKLFFDTTIPDSSIRIAGTVISIILLIVLIYFFGVIGQFVLGKRFISIGEYIFMKIPIVRTIYGSTQQVMKAMSLPDRNVFKSVVVLEFPRPGLKAIGFLTGYITGPNGKTLCKIFIPTTPNPTTGFFELASPEEVFITNISIEDGFKMIISGGVVSPDAFNAAETPRPSPLPQGQPNVGNL